MPHEHSETKLSVLTHPIYDLMIENWRRWRLTFEGGDPFIDNFLVKFSARETDNDFKDRKNTTYLPAHAKGAINTVRNGIFQRLVEVVRVDGPTSYQDAVIGQDNGVDLCGNSMNAYTGKFLLPELLVQGKVGIYTDNRRFRPDSRLDDEISRPYIYFYRAEDIRNWNFNSSNELTAVLLRDRYFADDPLFGLPAEKEDRFRLLNLFFDEVDQRRKVMVRFFNDDGDIINAFTQEVAIDREFHVILDIPEIPFEIAELTDSLMKDIYRYQVALLNAASSDVSYILKSNSPFYVEQYDPRYTDHIRGPGAGDGTGKASEAAASKKEVINQGPTSGRRYPKGMDAPQFIHPSPEPLKASMDKQTQMKEEIRQLVDLSLSNIHVKSASAESKKEDKEGLQAGLSAIGIVLETSERKTAIHWANYEREKAATVKYPSSYSLKTDAQRLEQAQERQKLKSAVPSVRYQKVMSKSIARSLFEGKVPRETLEEIEEEIEAADVIHSDVKDVLEIHKEGLLDDEGAGKALGIPKENVEQAQIDHAERIARIKAAQSSDDNAARGLTDLNANPNAAVEEKEQNNGDV